MIRCSSHWKLIKCTARQIETEKIGSTRKLQTIWSKQNKYIRKSNGLNKSRLLNFDHGFELISKLNFLRIFFIIRFLCNIECGRFQSSLFHITISIIHSYWMCILSGHFELDGFNLSNQRTAFVLSLVALRFWHLSWRWSDFSSVWILFEYKS